MAGILSDPSRRRGLIGIGLAAGAAFTFMVSTIGAVISYEGGGEPLAAITIRYLGAILVFVPLIFFSRLKFMLPRRERLIALGLGCILSIQSYCLYNSIAHIPVGLTFAIFYIYPMIVAGIAIAFGQDRITPAIGVGLFAAFAGLILVFNVTGEGLNLRGAALALGAALTWSVVTVVSGRIMQTQDLRPFTLHLQLSAATIYIVVCLVIGDISLPETTKGWAGFIALPIFYAASTLGFFGAVLMIGSIRAALVMNLEPVFTIAAGFVVLDQVLSPLQLAGAALVIGAVFAVRIDKVLPKTGD